MTEKTPSILIVDDEEMVISSLRGVFALQTDYQVHEATDPRKAIEQVERTSIDVVISDFLMPEMNGIEFLKEVRQLQPDAARLLLTGYADKENAIKAINEVGLYHYLEKPWDNDALLNIVKNALEEKGLRKRLEQKVRELDRLVSEHTELESRHLVLERELQMAANVQRSLLPDRFPELDDFSFSAFYEPCEAGGGDFHDVVTHEDRTVVLIADVIGHGIQAVLSTMLLKGLFQEGAARSSSPVELLAEMSERLSRVLPDGMYTAASVFVLEHGSPEIQFSNAGLPYPFVLRKEGRLDEIVLGGSPLGLFPGSLSSYEARTLELAPGDVLLGGSDGLGSIHNGNEEFFEDRALRETLGELAGRDGKSVIEEAVKRARAFGGDRPLPDDVNLLAITRR